jgi:transcription antitermination factor NusG
MWYALRVRPRHEQTSAACLDSRGLEQLAPTYRTLRRWSDRYKQVDLPLFPGYVFCRFAPDRKLSVVTAPGVLSIVSFGRTEVPIDDEDIAGIQSLIRSGLPVGPWPYLRAGDRIRIESGCLEGVCGTLVREKDTCRVVVSVEILQRSVAVEIARDRIRPEMIGPVRRELAAIA